MRGSHRKLNLFRFADTRSCHVRKKQENWKLCEGLERNSILHFRRERLCFILAVIVSP